MTRLTWLITRAGLEEAPMAPFADDLAAWLEAHDAEAVLVRPDRHVFGTGEAESLRSAWQAMMAA